MDTIQTRLSDIRHRIQQTLLRCQRDPASLQLIAVSKFQPIEALQIAYQEGLHQFGENYVQEALPKIAHFQSYDAKPIWHFIGPLQSNKTRLIAEHFDWVHTVDRFSIAQRLSQHRQNIGRPLCICLQVNLSKEPQKNGCSEESLNSLITQIQTLPHLQLRGLMALPSAAHTNAEISQIFQRLCQIQEQLKREFQLPLDVLSMGMSQDLELAIENGSTHLRIGTAIFGHRPPIKPVTS